MKYQIVFALVCLQGIGSTVNAASVEEILGSVRQALAAGDQDRALQLAEQAVDAEPKNAMALATRAAVHELRRDFAKAAADYGLAIAVSPNTVDYYQRRGEDLFRLGRFKESVADFDKVIELRPAQEPYHWQRGISQYYAGDFAGGVKQFESHKAVNPEDVENAVWHYLCLARLSGVAEARKRLIPIRADTRVPMMQVHAMFAGKLTPDDVLAVAKQGEPDERRLKQRLFYAHLYIGLFDEAAGQKDKARAHLLLAEKYAENDYMGDVARVHAALLKPAGTLK